MALSRFCTNKLVSQLCLRLPVILLQQSPRPSSCVSKWSPPRVLHTSSMLMSLDEFFPRTSDIIKEGEHAGMRIAEIVAEGVTNHWTGLLDSKFTVSCTVTTTIVSPHLKPCPSVGHQSCALYSGHPSAPNQLQGCIREVT